MGDEHPGVDGNATTPEARPRGRLFGRNVAEAVFRAPPEEDLFLGELLVGEDDATGRRYLFRVVDVSYGTEHREPGWAERVAGTLLADDARGQSGAHSLYEQAKRTYRLAECRCLGYLAPPQVPGSARTVFRKPKSLPTQFSRVVSPTPEDFAFLSSRMGDLPIGHLRSGETVVDFPVGIPGSSLASHIGVFATTGMGKSNLLQVLSAGVMAANGRYGLLVVDPHGEHRGPLSRHPWASQSLRTYADRRLPNTSALRISLAELSVDDLRTAYEWSRPQEEALHELERHYSGVRASRKALSGGTAGSEAGRGASPGEGLAWLLDFVHVEDLAGFRDVELSARVALNTLQVVHRRARRVVELPCISPDPKVSVGTAILDDLKQGKVVLVDVSGLGGTEEVLVASYLTRRVLEEWQSAYLQGPERHRQLPVVALALEEAQRVLSASKDRDSNIFPRVAREGRKFGVGLLAVTQQPKLLEDELLSQFNTYFVLGLADERDRNILRSSAKQDISALGPEVQTLMPGECLLVNLAAPFAVPAAIYLYDEVARSAPPPPSPRPLAAPNVSALVD
ncbi:MAG TPA: ATP-binding protein [Acidimicrobiales bacterium]|nr:ATP-binding protein [Acidimicrobiales bacterium]